MTTSDTQPRQSSITPYATLLGGVTCIGFSAIFVRWANTTGDVATFFRLGIAALVMTLPVLIHRRRGRAGDAGGDLCCAPQFCRRPPT